MELVYTRAVAKNPTICCQSVAEHEVSRGRTYSDMVCLSCVGRYYYGDADYDAEVVCDCPPGEVGEVASNVCNERSDESDQPSKLFIRSVSRRHGLGSMIEGLGAHTYAIDIVASAKGSPTM